jgi:hypothetical protein
MISSKMIDPADIKPLFQAEMALPESENQTAGDTLSATLKAPMMSDLVAAMRSFSQMVRRVGFSMEDVRRSFRSHHPKPQP